MTAVGIDDGVSGRGGRGGGGGGGDNGDGAVMFDPLRGRGQCRLFEPYGCFVLFSRGGSF